MKQARFKGLLVLLCALSEPFAALAATTVTVSPGYQNLGVNSTLQYTAQVSGLANTAVRWQVNNVAGGNSTIGTISATGLYKSPATVPTVGTQIVAVAADGTLGFQYVNVEAAGPAITAINPNPLAVGNPTLTITGFGFNKGAMVSFNGGVMSSTYVNATTLKTSVYQLAPGTGTIQVMNLGSLWSAPFTVTFVNPQVVSPTSASVKLGATLQFTSSGATSWTATAGSISSAGLYTAPATMPASSAVTVTATGPGGSASAAVTLVAAEPQRISPAAVSVRIGQTQQFTSARATAWTATAGAISSSGLYTAPSTMPASNAVTVTAIGPGGSAQAAVTLMPIPPQTILPATVKLDLGTTQQFTSAGATAWTTTLGTVSSTGLYTAPAAWTGFGSATVTATGPGGSASAAVTIVDSTPTTILPAVASVVLGATQQFTSSGGTSWSAVNGTISGTGLYTAPAALPTPATDIVAVTGLGGSASASITLVPPTPTITAVGTNGQIPLGIFSTTIGGTGFLANSAASLNGTPLTTTYSSGALLTVSGLTTQSGAGNVTVSNGSEASAPFTVQIGVPNAQVSVAAAHRFLEQAAFGPSPTDSDTVQALGFQAWLTNQFNMPQISNYNAITSDQSGLNEQFLVNAVNNPDQLRQRVGFALSQIFVTSVNTIIWNQSMIPYEQMLQADAFTNYRQILGDVTVSPTMGQYLNMANNAMADPVAGTVANENYAREVMQLFTIGTTMLNPNGSMQLDGNNMPIPTYSQATIGETARVFTGWTYQPSSGSVEWNDYINPAGPMVPYPSEHDTGSKQLVNGYVAPAGLTPQQDLDGALDNIFNHPNAGPFVSKLLIQHLVKSNPSPAYIQRVASAFANNGSGVRGDMKAVITAILLDPEARANDNGGDDQPTDGHLQEPVLFIAGMVRAFGGTMTNQDYFGFDLVNMNQDMYNAPSVFNYYSPSFSPPGSNVLGPEFQLDTPDSAVYRSNMVANLFSSWSNPVLNYGPGTNIDVTPYVALASNPTTLVAALDLTLTHGVMPAQMKQDIVTAVTNDTNGNLSRVLTGSWLILSSSYYNVWH
jgi:uncharacterized protein (DUF1800 family)